MLLKKIISAKESNLRSNKNGKSQNTEKSFPVSPLVKYCLLKIEEKGEIIMPTIKDAIIMIKNAWKQVNYIISYYIYSVYVYKCIYLLGNKRNNS